jgi:excisionase family DNA binding protein
MIMTVTRVINKNSSMPDLSEYMTTQEAAGRLGFNIKSVRNMIYNGTLEAIRFNRTLLISRKSVNDYIARTAGMSKTDPRRRQSEN